MLAQSLVEYSALSTVSESLRRAMYSVQDVVGSLTASQWAVLGAVIVLGLVLKGRRASR